MSGPRVRGEAIRARLAILVVDAFRRVETGECRGGQSLDAWLFSASDCNATSSAFLLRHTNLSAPLKRYRTHECVLPSTKVLDELGEAIRTSTMTPTDWALFDELSREWWRTLNSIETEIKNLFSGSDFGTLREKLRRTTRKLSEVRDIIGCRVVVLNQNEDQDLVVRRITESIQAEKFKIID